MEAYTNKEIMSIEDVYPWEAWHLHPHHFRGKVTTTNNPESLRDLVLKIGSELKLRRERHERQVALDERFMEALSAYTLAESQVGTEAIKMLDLSPSDEDRRLFDGIFDGSPLPSIREEAHCPAFAVTTESDEEEEFFEPQSTLKPLTRPIVPTWNSDVSSYGFDDAPLTEEQAWEANPAGESPWTRRFREAEAAFSRALCSLGRAILGVAHSWSSRLVKMFAWAGGLIPVVSTQDGKLWCVSGVCAAVVAVGAAAFFVKAMGFVSRLVTAACDLAYSVSESLMVAMGMKVVEQSNIKDEQRAPRTSIGLRSVPPSGGKPFTFTPGKPREFSSQAGIMPTDDRIKAVYANQYKMLHITTDGPIPIGSVQFLEGNLAVMPCHFRETLKDASGSIKFISVEQDKFTFVLPIAEFLGYKGVQYVEYDLEFVSFGIKSLKAHRCVTKHLLSEKQLSEFFRGSHFVSLLGTRAILRADKSIMIHPHTFESPMSEFVPLQHVKGGVIHQLIKYHASTEAGDCGAPLVISENRYWGGNCLLGIHVAGLGDAISRRGLSAVLSQEMVLKARQTLDTYKDDIVADLQRRGITLTPPTEEEVERLVGDKKLVDGSFLLVGKVDKPLSMGTQTALKISPMGEDEIFGPCPKAPAVLRPTRVDGEVKYPAREAMRAYQSPLEVREIPLLSAVANRVTAPFRKATTFYPRYIMTPEEAARSIPGIKLKKVARETSAGYPYRLEHQSGKTAFFGEDGEYLLNTPAWYELKKDTLHIVEEAKKGNRTAVIYTDFLKDELRPLHKVEAVATRAISGCPADYVLAVRMYFGAFLAAMFGSHIDSMLAPGINPYTEWGLLASKLRAMGEEMFAGDFSRFDASGQPQVYFEILEIINGWYRDVPDWCKEDERVRNILFLDLIHSRHLTGEQNKLEYVVQWNKSLPSGHPLTTAVNSFYSLITIGVCYTHLTGDLENITENMYAITFGDDNVVSPKDTLIDVFNQITVSEKMMEVFGLTYTSDKKDEALRKCEDITGVTFLQRSFAYDKESAGGIAAPLAEKSFLYVPYWYRSKKATDSDMLDNVKNLLGELSQHTPERWEQVTSVLFPWLRQHDLLDRLPFTTREAVRAWVNTRGEIWF
jgi:hypothetical protein